MNNKIKIIILISALFLVLPTINLFSLPNTYACPNGYVSLTETVTITVDNDTCSYNVRLCVSCPAGTHPVPFEIILNQFEPADSSCILNPIGLQQAILEVVTDPVWIEANIADDCFAGWGPCPANAVTVIGVAPLCLRKVKYLDDHNVIKIMYAGCYENDCSCKIIKEICWDGENQNFRTTIIETYRGDPRGCISPCEFVPEPPDSSIPDPTPEEPFPQSECFVGNSPCSE